MARNRTKLRSDLVQKKKASAPLLDAPRLLCRGCHQDAGLNQRAESSLPSKSHLSQVCNTIKKACRMIDAHSRMKKPRTLLLTGARKSLWKSGGVTGGTSGGRTSVNKPMMAGMGSKKPQRASGVRRGSLWVCFVALAFAGPAL